MSAAFRVASWLVKPTLNIISGKGTTAHLEPKVMEVLVCLADHAGEAVSKEELVQTVWPDTFVSDDALKRCIFELRRVFDDDAREPSIIETIPKRGYRLIATIDRSTVAAPSAPTPSLTRDSIAVLPFVNISADPENEFFADGITEEIINALAHIPELYVAARSSAFSFKGKHVDSRVIGEQLKVRTILEGSVRRAGNCLRITAQLVNAGDGYHLWSERYDRESKDIFEIQDEIARSIASRLKLTLEAKSQGALVKPGTTSVEAYSLYTKARALMYRRGAMILLALECLKQAVAIDPDYALAWAGMADTYALLGFYGFVHPQTSRPKWREAANHALAADESLAEAHSAVAFGSLMYELDKAEAEREFLRALELNPRYIQARDFYALFCLQLAAGQLADGVEHAKLALDADPLSSYAHSVASLTFMCAGIHSRAVQSAQRAIELDSESFLPRWSLQSALYRSGQFDQAVAAAQTALAMSGRHPWAMAILALTLADWRKTLEAEAVYLELLARARREYVLPSTLALAATAAAQSDNAMTHVREAVSIHDPYSIPAFSSYWVGAHLRADSRIDQFLKEHGID